jgi:DNA mismatch repair protein MutS2
MNKNGSETTVETQDFDAHTLRVLEYAAVQKMLAERAACSLGQERARELLPTPLVAFVRERLQETTEARRLTDEHGPFPLGGIYDIRPLLVRAEVSHTLSPTELLNITSTLTGAARLKLWLLRYAEIAPLLSDRAKAIEEFPQLLRDIEICIGRGGDVLDSASPTLGQIRSRVRVLSARITEKLNSFLNSSTFRAMLMDAVIVLRDDRRCLAVRSEYKRAIPGIVHDQSSSGATVFIEPMVVVDTNNELRQAEAKEQQEIERILGKLTALVARFGTKIYGTVEVTAGLDLASAKAKLAEDMQASEPLFNQNGTIKLHEARHPLIDPEKVVPISVAFGDHNKALLITGPNTGGKTVTLKTVGLLTLMGQAGLHIPAGSGSELAHFDQVFADIGDEQSITQSLSTFSSHITNIVRILRTVGMRALVLLDELGAGTDPAEGAALAKAIVSYLLKHNARIIATTHYGELKEFAYMRDNIENAAVEFDPETLRPTYRLLQGIPGSSNAFHIARRLGIPNPVVDEALGNLERTEVETGVLMQRLERAKRVADDERLKAQRLSREVEELKRKYEARLHDLEVLRREAKQRATEEAQQVIRQKTEKMNNILGELRRQGKENRKTNSVRKKMQETADELIGGIGYEQAPAVVEDDSPVPQRLKRGDKVRVLSLGGMQGEVISDSQDGDVMVQVGMMRVTVPLEQLRNERASIPIVPASTPTLGTSGGAGGTATLARAKAEAISPELTLIAMRVDAALPRLDKYLDDAYAAGLDTIRIVHGKGTGQLRKAIWEALKGDSRILAYQTAHPDEGGAGATIVRLNV